MDTSGELKGSAGTTSTAGNDTFKATVATLGSLDVIDGGAGNNTFNIVDSAAVNSLTATVDNFTTLNVQTESSIGTGSATAAPATTTLVENGAVTTGVVVLQVGSVQVTADSGEDSDLAAAITSALQSQGFTVQTVAANLVDGEVLVDSSTAGTVLVQGLETGAALPAISVVSGAAANLPSIAVVAGTQASSATFSVSGVDGLTEANLVAGAEIVARASTKTDVYAEAGGTVSVTGGKNVEVGLSVGGATVTGSKGTVSVYEAFNGDVLVEGGTTVTVIKEGSTLSSTTGQPTGSAYAGNITVGVDASFGANPTTATGFPQVDANVAKQATGDVIIANYTNYTTPLGAAARVYGSGTAAVYSNGGSAVSVATAGAVTIKDVQVAARIAAAGELAAPGTSKLATARIDGTNAAGSVTSDALTALTLVNAGASAAITVNNAAAHALALTLGNNTSGSSVIDATAASVTVTTEAQSISSALAASASTTTIRAANATSLTFNNANAVTLGNTALADLTALTSVVATGAGRVSLGDITGAGRLTSVDASAASGGLVATVGGTGSFGLNLKGSSGADTITLKSGATLAAALVSGANVTTSLTLGAGTDAVNAVDTVVIGGPSPSTTLAGAGAAFTATAASSPTSSFVLGASALTKISDLASGDTIDLSAAASSSASVGDLFTSLATDTSSEGVFTAATTLDGLINQAITDGTKAIDWFVFQGDTYVVVDGSTLTGSTSGSNLNDYVIHLVGDYTASLTGVSALASGVLTLG